MEFPQLIFFKEKKISNLKPFGQASMERRVRGRVKHTMRQSLIQCMLCSKRALSVQLKTCTHYTVVSWRISITCHLTSFLVRWPGFNVSDLQTIHRSTYPSPHTNTPLSSSWPSAWMISWTKNSWLKLNLSKTEMTLMGRRKLFEELWRPQCGHLCLKVHIHTWSIGSIA